MEQGMLGGGVRGGRGASFRRILQAVVSTLAFIPNEMGAMGRF